MKLFLSWSGERSRRLAESLYHWLPGVINAVEPWLSSSDIDPGSRWGLDLAQQLEKTQYGIICVTVDNLNSPWLLFEAGALSKFVTQSRVVPLLLDIKPTDIKGPLAQFQTIQANEDEIRKLILGMNQTAIELGEKGLTKEIIDESFRLWWPRLRLSLESIPKELDTVKRNERTEREMIEELLILVRNIIAVPSHRILNENDRDDMPPPPDNFSNDWDREWQPSFEDASITAKGSGTPKTSKSMPPPRRKS